jgi:hypothetical protein
VAFHNSEVRSSFAKKPVKVKPARPSKFTALIEDRAGKTSVDEKERFDNARLALSDSVNSGEADHSTLATSTPTDHDDSQSSRHDAGGGHANPTPRGTPDWSSENAAMRLLDGEETRIFKIELAPEIQAMVQGESYVTVRVPLTASLHDLLGVVQRKLQREFSAVEFGFESTDPNSQRLWYDRYMLVQELSATRIRLARIATTAQVPAPAHNVGIRPDASIFHFTTSSAVELTEYRVKVDIPGEASGRAASLVVCYPRLLHQWTASAESSAPPNGDGPLTRRTRSLTRMLGLDHAPPWQQDGALLDVLEELNVDDVESAECDEEALTFVVHYHVTERNKTRSLAIKYHAETPTECALIVAHLQYLIKFGGE